MSGEWRGGTAVIVLGKEDNQTDGFSLDESTQESVFLV